MWAVGCGPPGLVLQVVVLVGMTVMVAMAVETISVVAVVRVSTSNGMMSVMVKAGSVTIMVAEAVIVTREKAGLIGTLTLRPFLC